MAHACNPAASLSDMYWLQGGEDPCAAFLVLGHR